MSLCLASVRAILGRIPARSRLMMKRWRLLWNSAYKPLPLQYDSKSDCSSSFAADVAGIGHVLWVLIVGGVGGLTISTLWVRQQRTLRKNTGQREDPPDEADE